jgi:glycine cleavage system H lipoate-binding protein
MTKLSKESSKNLKCIWMSAGIINYKLCNCELHCEQCEFDKAMLQPSNTFEESEAGFLETIKGEFKEFPSVLTNQYMYSFFSGCKIHLDRIYHPSHFWYKIESENLISAGINKLLLKLFAPVQEFVLPEVGDSYLERQPTVWIKRPEYKIKLNSGITGKVVEVNNNYVRGEIPHEINKDVYFFKIKEQGIKEKIVENYPCIRGFEYFTRIVLIVGKYLNRVFKQQESTDLGVTVADGGQMQVCLEKVLGERNYQEMLNDLFESPGYIDSIGYDTLR